MQVWSEAGQAQSLISPLVFLAGPDEELCLVRHIRAYLACMGALNDSTALFLTTVPPHGLA